MILRVVLTNKGIGRRSIRIRHGKLLLAVGCIYVPATLADVPEIARYDLLELPKVVVEQSRIVACWEYLGIELDVRVQVIDSKLVIFQNPMRRGSAVIGSSERGIKVDCLIVVLDGPPVAIYTSIGMGPVEGKEASTPRLLRHSNQLLRRELRLVPC